MSPSEESQRINLSVPQAQLDEWDADVEEHGYPNRTVWIREMVETGRKQFEQMNPAIASEGGRDLRNEVLDVVDDEPMTWEEIRDAVVGEVEDELEEALSQLVKDGMLEHSPRDGGYENVRS